MVLPISQNPCAAGQGALAIESREGDSEVDKIMKRLITYQFLMKWKKKEVY